MKEKLTHNLGLKILALLFSISLWLISININDPVSPRNYTIQVQLLNINSMINAGKYVEVQDDTDTVRVTVRASRSVLSDFSEKNLVATADINDLTENNRIPIQVTTTKTDNKIESIKTDKEYVSVKIEDVKKIQKTIDVIVQNTPASGYMLGSTSTDQTAVIVSGPESVVSRIAKAEVEINVDGATSDVSMSRPIHFYDKEGELIDDTKLTKSVSEVSTKASILQMKEVPIECSVTGKPADGYLYAGDLTTEPRVITIAGKASTMKNITKITIPDAIDVTGADSNVAQQVDIKQYLPEGVVLADTSSGGKVTITATIQKEESKIVKISSNQINVRNIPQGYDVTIKGMEDTIEIRLYGLQEQLDTINANSLQGYVDMELYAREQEMDVIKPGNYYPAVKFELPEYVYLKEDLKVHIWVEETE